MKDFELYSLNLKSSQILLYSATQRCPFSTTMVDIMFDIMYKQPEGYGATGIR